MITGQSCYGRRVGSSCSVVLGKTTRHMEHAKWRRRTRSKSKTSTIPAQSRSGRPGQVRCDEKGLSQGASRQIARPDACRNQCASSRRTIRRNFIRTAQRQAGGPRLSSSIWRRRVTEGVTARSLQGEELGARKPALRARGASFGLNGWKLSRPRPAIRAARSGAGERCELNGVAPRGPFTRNQESLSIPGKFGARSYSCHMYS